MSMYQAKYKKDCEHTRTRTYTHKNRQYRLPGQRQMCILDKAESQDITTTTTASDKILAQ